MNKEIIAGRYEFNRVVDVVGRGGMGTVYRGRNIETGGTVAIKQLRPDLTDNNIISRFYREASTLQRMKHPHIITLFDIIHDDPLGQFLVMEYIEGGSLWDELQTHPQIGLRRVLMIGAQLASALMILHEEGVIHRDVKPSNVLIAHDKSPRLADFGVIHLKDHTRLTETGSMIGTLDYLAPEALNGDPITQQADIWALGVMLYEMVAGVRPFASDSPSALIAAILTKTPPALARLRPDVPPDLIRLIEWMLVKNPADRIPTMSAVYHILNDMLTGVNTTNHFATMRTTSTKQIAYKRIGSLPKLFTDGAFHDRENQQTQMINAITTGEVFIGVYGRGGIGKTALVCKVLGDFEATGNVDGVAYLRADTIPPLNISILLDSLSEFISPEHGFHAVHKNAKASIVTKSSALLDALDGGRYVVYLDNIETLQHPDSHVLLDDDLRQFFEMVLGSGKRNLAIVITSRYPIPFPNTLKPYEVAIHLDEGLPQADAIQLLRHIDKQKVLPNTDDQLHVWIDKVGGYPRGLEALVGYLSGGASRHIDDLLADDALFKGEVLSNIVHHIHDTLPPAFRQVMAGVAVIGQNTTRAELEYLLSPYFDSARLRFILERLLDGHFLSYNRQTRTYSLHPIDQDYALSSTPAGSSTDEDSAFTHHTLHRRMADYFLNLRKPQTEWRILDDLTPQLREMEHRYAIKDYDGVATILITIDIAFLLSWGYTELVMLWHSRLDNQTTQPSIIQACLGNLGTLHQHIGDADKSYLYTQKALDMARTHHDKFGEAKWLGAIGILHRSRGEAEKSIEYHQQALQIYRELGDKEGETSQLGGISNAYASLGMNETAISYYQQTLSLAREIGNRRLEGNQLINLGVVYSNLGQSLVAITHYEQSLVIARELNLKINESAILNNLGTVYNDSGQLEKAIDYYQQSLIISRQIKNRAGEAQRLANLGSVYNELGDNITAIPYFEQALVIFKDIQDNANYGNHLGNLGFIYADLGRYDEAIDHLHRAIEIVMAVKSPELIQGKHIILARVYWELGNNDNALKTIRIASQYDVTNQNYLVMNLEGCFLYCMGQPDEAHPHFENARVNSEALLAQTPNQYDTLYNRALSYTGLWLVKGDPTHYQLALTSYQEAKTVCNYKGVLGREHRKLATLLACSDKDGSALIAILQ